MNLVSNTKTLIFDDKYDEIENLRKALDSLKIQNLYIKFDEIDNIIEEEKFTNVRFVFADIISGTSRVGVKSDISAIIASMNEHISKRNGAFVLIIWSKNQAELADELIYELKSDGFNFFPIKSIDKTKYTGDVPSELLEELIGELKKELADNTEYFNLLRVWERDVHTATSETFNILLDNLEDKDRTHSLLKNAIIASAGTKQRPDDREKRKYLWNTLNMLLHDNIEAVLRDIPIPVEIEPIINKFDKKSELLTNSIVNKKLLFSNTSKYDSKMYPGNIFCFDDYKSKCDHNNELLVNVCGYDVAQTFDDLFNDKEFSDYIKDIKKVSPCTKAEQKIFKSKYLNEIKKSMYPILMEYTPFCDYSQKGFRKARLIFGYFIPTQYMKFIRGSAKYIYATAPIELNIPNKLNGDYSLVLNIKQLIGLNPEKLNDFDLILRARKELVNDVQHDIASHVSRVGVTSL